ncbi:MAG: glycosyltransferase family 2 protein, partial [gamma proteobacterium symbiont of Bathyaustriella thionipta]|nr:glycosyltransferase family 2 protein [gamma proteobacterium symbiont of Bathyaustriella thionipta]
MQECNDTAIKRDIHLSVISHHHAELVQLLLVDLARLACAQRLQVTLISNIPEAIELKLDDLSFPVKHIINKAPIGFGENHNQAFNHLPLPDERNFFLVINPDVRIYEDVISSLVQKLSIDNKIGVIAPRVINNEGDVEDSARPLPTFTSLLKKIFGHRSEWNHQGKNHCQPDWIAGMFMLFRIDVYEQLGGFDKKFFLYYEDVDLCSRLWLQGYSVQVDISAVIVHNAQRASHRKLKFLLWHLSSMALFLTSR